MNARIRPARPADARGIAQVHVQSWRETYQGLISDEYLNARTGEQARAQRETNWQGIIQNPEKIVYVAELSGEPVAFASGDAPQHPGFDAELYTLYSLKKGQGHGLGKTLLQAIAGELHARGAKNMALWVLDANPTRHWYARQGATEAGEKQEGGLREIRMVWDDLTTLTR